MRTWIARKSGGFLYVHGYRQTDKALMGQKDAGHVDASTGVYRAAPAAAGASYTTASTS
jgi:hypothetical protein